MVRGKIEMKKIENATSRQVTFCKRRTGLLKKAHELSVLCDAQVAAIIFSQKGKLSEFSSIDMRKMIDRYHKYTKQVQTDRIDAGQYVEELKHEAANMAKKIEILRVSHRKLLGQDMNSCSIEELHEITNQLERSLCNIRARKAQLFKEEIAKLQAKERSLLEENARLCEQCGERRPWMQPAQHKQAATFLSFFNSKRSDINVETELFIGLPEMRCL